VLAQICKKVDVSAVLTKQAKDKCIGKFDWGSRGALLFNEIEVQVNIVQKPTKIYIFYVEKY